MTPALPDHEDGLRAARGIIHALVLTAAIGALGRAVWLAVVR